MGKIINKINEDSVEKAILVFPFWKAQSWFPLVLSNICSLPVRLPRLVADGTQWRKSSFESTDEVDHCDYIRQILYHRGIPESASKFILNSWSQGTRKQYQSVWNMWMAWNGFRFMDPSHN